MTEIDESLFTSKHKELHNELQAILYHYKIRKAIEELEKREKS
jgi:hypothetical protein